MIGRAPGCLTATLLPSDDGIHANLFATIGPPGDGGIAFSGHMDVVPVAGQPWDTDPFALVEKDGRLYGRGTAHRHDSPAYRELLPHFGAEPLGARQIVVLDVDLVQTSCGFGVPLYGYEGERPSLARWAENKGPGGLEAYRREKNAVSIDGLPTGF